MDSIGTLLVLNDLIRHASEEYSLGEKYHLSPLGNEQQNLSPSFRTAAGLSSTIIPGQFQRIKDPDAALGQDCLIFSMPFNNSTNDSGKHELVATALSSARTTSILIACGAASLSVTHAYHTAVPMAVRDPQPSQPSPETKRCINTGSLTKDPTAKHLTTPPPTQQQSTTPSPAST